MEFLTSIISGLITSVIFYLIVVYYPQKKEEKIAIDFLVESYKSSKEQIIRDLAQYLHKNGMDAAKKNCLNYEQMRITFTDADIASLRNYDNPDRFRELNLDVLYELSRLRNPITNILYHPFIKQNEQAYRRLCNLINWIDQYHYYFNRYYRDNDDYDFSKSFCIFINEHLRGISQAYGPKQSDDFVDLIQSSHERSLFRGKIRYFFKMAWG